MVTHVTPPFTQAIKHQITEIIIPITPTLFHAQIISPEEESLSEEALLKQIERDTEFLAEYIPSPHATDVKPPESCDESLTDSLDDFTVIENVLGRKDSQLVDEEVILSEV